MWKKWDIFISHASEDKEAIVKPIVKTLVAYGVKVWYDEFSLGLGDSLSRSIDKGLADSSYGLVVLSSAFFSKDWPEYELKGLNAREIGRDKVILPLWHNIDRDDVLKYSPTLADKLSITTNKHTIDEIALKIIEVVRPDIFRRIHKKIAYEKLLENSLIAQTKPSNIRLGPIRHEKLPDELITRIRLIRAALLIVYPHTMEFWIGGFQRDAHPTKEIEWWEHVASCFLEYSQFVELSFEQLKAAYSVIFCLCNGFERKNIEDYIKILPEGEFSNIERMVKHKLPMYELLDVDSGFPDNANLYSKESLERYHNVDKEEFDV